MIVDLPETSASAVDKRLMELRAEFGVVMLGRVLNLVVITDEISVEAVVKTANEASHEHPCRVIVVVRGNPRGKPRLDAQIRIGGDAGASEVVILRSYGQLINHPASVVVPLLLPDTPVVAWWPRESPEVPAEDLVGRLAQRRITDAAACSRPLRALRARGRTYQPGDTDLAWTRTTLWRALLAAALDQSPHEPITSATVTGSRESPSVELIAAWLANALDCPVSIIKRDGVEGLQRAMLTQPSGTIDVLRPDGDLATLTIGDQQPRTVSLPRRSDTACLAEELRRLDPDEIYAQAVTRGLQRIAKKVVDTRMPT